MEHDIASTLLQSRYNLIRSIISAEITPSQRYLDFKKLLAEDFIPLINKNNVIKHASKIVLQLKSIEKQIRQIDAMMHFKNKTVVAVSGGFSSGKSSFISSLFSDKNISLPVGIEPITAIPTYVVHANQNRIIGYNNHFGTADIPYDIYSQLSHEFVEDFGFNLRKLLPFIALETPMEEYQHLSFIDLPGYNPGERDGYEGEDNLQASTFMAKAHCVFWVLGLDANGTISTSDIEFINQHLLTNMKLYVILNKADLRDPDDIQSIIDDVNLMLEIEGIEVEGISAYSSNLQSELFYHKKSLYQILNEWNSPQDTYQECRETVTSVFDEYEQAFITAIDKCKHQISLLKSFELDLHEIGVFEEKNMHHFNSSKYRKSNSISSVTNKDIDTVTVNHLRNKISSIKQSLTELRIDYDFKKLEQELEQLKSIRKSFDEIISDEYGQINEIMSAAKLGEKEAQFKMGLLYYKGNHVEKNEHQAKILLEYAAEQGHSEAQYQLGNINNIGNGITQDILKAVVLYKKAAKQGHSHAQYQLGYIYSKGNGVEQNYKIAKEWYDLAAKQGNSDAQYELGEIYYNAYGVSKSYKIAKEWYELAASQNNQSAIFRLGEIYYLGKDTKINYEYAKDKFESLAINNFIAAQCRLAEMYYSGNGLIQNYFQAMIWYKRAAKLGSTEAKYYVGELYFKGLNVEKDYIEANIWYEQAATENYPDAQYKLGLIYNNGYGLEVDIVKAKIWYERAAKQNHSAAQYQLGEIYYNGSGVKKDYQSAIKWYELSAAKGHALAQYKLGEIHYHGHGAEINYSKAKNWYDLSAKQDCHEAIYRLGEMYYLGVDIAVNYDEAKLRFELLAKLNIRAAQCRLAEMYYLGNGYEQNYGEAIIRFQYLADEKYPDAQYYLGNIFHSGKGVKRNFKEARKWYKLAAEQNHADAAFCLSNMYLNGEGVERNRRLANKWLKLSGRSELIEEPKKRFSIFEFLNNPINS